MAILVWTLINALVIALGELLHEPLDRLLLRASASYFIAIGGTSLYMMFKKKK